jgi:nucleoside 2-deoxyribosyltransferase
MNTEPKLERIAALLHEGWMNYKCRKEPAFRYGRKRTTITHPHYVPCAKLPQEAQSQDRFIAAGILRDWGRGALAVSDLPAAIHNIWAEWSNLSGTPHPHALPFYQAHTSCAEEHEIQAALILPHLSDDVSLIVGADSERRCLLLLPFRPQTLAVCDEVIAPAVVKAGYIPVRADRLRSSKSIHEDVVDQIEQSSAVIADLTYDNPNVNYEIGLARSLGRPIIMIAEQRPPGEVPFYYKGQRIQFYDRTLPDWQKALTLEVQRALAHAVRTDPLSEHQSIGLTGCYAEDNPAFEAALLRDIEKTSRRFTAVGLGLACLLAQRRHLLNALRRQLLQHPRMQAHIILPRKDHPGLVARIEEEENHQPATGKFPDWPSELFRYAMELPNSLRGFPKERVRVKRLPYLPMTMVLKLDSVFYLRCYGPPTHGGWACPWLRCEQTIASRAWSGFLEYTVGHAIKECFAE